MPDSPLITVDLYALLYSRAGAGVCLLERATGKIGVIFIDLPAGITLERLFNAEEAPRPDSATLMANILEGMDATVRLILIHHREEDVYHARITLDVRNEAVTKLLELDARPSDALMLAAKFRLPIKVNPAVWRHMEDIAPLLDQLEPDSTPDSRAPVYLLDL